MKAILFSALVALGAAGCSAAGVREAQQNASDPARADAANAPASAVQAPPDVIERGRTALREAGVTAELHLISATATEWSDSSLGCPTEGAMYLQVITPGHALRFADKSGRNHEVHVSKNSAVVCSRKLEAK